MMIMLLLLLLYYVPLSPASQKGNDNIYVSIGSDATLQCKLNGTFNLPEWAGPPDFSIYNDEGSKTFNDKLEDVLEKRLHWNNNNKDLVIKSVKKSDNGTYRCFHNAYSHYMVNLLITDPKDMIGSVNTIDHEDATGSVNTTDHEDATGSVNTTGSKYTIAAVVVALVLIVVGILVVIYKILRRHQRPDSEQTEPLLDMPATFNKHLTAQNVAAQEKLTIECSDTITYNDLRLRHLFENAMTYGNEEEHFLRIMVVGCYKHGKTSLIRRLLGESTDPVETTDGIDVTENMCCTSEVGKWKKLNTEQNNDEIMKNIVLSTQTHPAENQTDEYVNELETLTVNTNGDFVMDTVDVGEKYHTYIDTVVNIPLAATDYSGVEQTPEQVEDKFVPTPESNADLNIVAASTGHNKSDGQEHISAPEEASIGHHLQSERATKDNKLEETMFSKFAAGYLAKEPIEKNWLISLWDFAGQFVYYATHQLFHSRKSLYLLVFDLSKSLDEPIKDEEFCKVKTMKDYMDFWVSSIHSFVGSEDSYENHISWSPCIILVGSHASDLNEKQIKAQFDKIREYFHTSHLQYHIYEQEFAVDNLRDSDDIFENLRKEIETIAKKKIKIGKIPNNWNTLEIALCDKKDHPIITVSDVIEINNNLEFSFRDDINLFLIYCHEKGRLFYSEDDNHVVLSPQFIIDAFKSIITSKSFCMRTKLSTVQHFWSNLFDHAKLKPKCVEDLWNEKLKNATEKDKEELKLFLQHKETIFEFLEKNRIISKVVDVDEIVYLVPSFLKADENKIVVDFTSGKSSTQISVVFAFKYSPIVPTLFHRTIAAALGLWKLAAFKGQSLVFENVAAFKIDDESHHVGIISMNGTQIELLIVFLEHEKSSSIAESGNTFRRFVTKSINYEFRKMKDRHIKESEKPFTLKFRCMHEHNNDHKLSPSKTIKNIGDVWNIERHFQIKDCIPCLDSVGKNVICIPEACAEWFLGDLDFKQVLCMELTERDLSMISSTIFRDFKCVIDKLGKQLGLEDDALQYNPNDVHDMRVYKMLLKWKEIQENKGHTALSDDLLRAIGRCEGLVVDCEEIRNFFDEKGHTVSVSQNGSLYMYSEATSDEEHKWNVVNVLLYSNSTLIIRKSQTEQMRIYIKDVWEMLVHGEALSINLLDIPALPQEASVSCLLAIPEKPSCRSTPHYLLFGSAEKLEQWMKAIGSTVPQIDLQKDLTAYYRKMYKYTPLSPLMPKVVFPLLQFYVYPAITGEDFKHHPFEQEHLKHDLTVKSYKEIFFDKEDMCKNIYLTSPASFGKSAFIKRMALVWCHAKDPKNEDKHYFSDCNEDIASIRRFSFVFYVCLRKIDKFECDLESMIMNQIINNLSGSSKFMEQQILEVLVKEECLILIDGLDQWSHPADRVCRHTNINIPHRRHREKTTILTTSRLWRYVTAGLKSQEVDQLLELSGLDDNSANMLINNVIACLNENYNTRKQDMEFHNIFDNSCINVLKSIPFILIQLVCLWFEKGKIGNSHCEVYKNIVKLLFTPKPGGSVDKLSYKTLLHALGKLAYHTLSYEQSVLFEKDKIGLYIKDPSDFALCLASGIIVDTEKDSSAEKHGKFKFIHKSCQEYLAAYYLSRNIGILEENTAFCNSVKSMLVMRNILMFLSGMSWKVVPEQLTKHLRNVINEDECTKKYRFESKGAMWFIEADFFYSRLVLQKLQTLMIDCCRESISKNNNIPLPLEDYFLYDDVEKHMSHLTRLFEMNHSHIKSILLKTKFTADKNTEILRKLNINNITSLEALSVKCNITDEDVSVILKNATHLQYLGFSNIRLPSSFGMITALNNLLTLSLSVVKVPHMFINKLVETLVSMTQLKHLSLYRVSCEEHNHCKMNQFDISALTELQALKLVDCENILPDSQINICPSNMEECRLTSCNRSGIIGTILTCLQDAPKLTTLVLSNFKDRKDIDCLRDSLANMKHLKCIDVSHIDFKNKPLVITSAMKSIKQIKVHFCKIENQAIYDFAKCISDVELPRTVHVDIVDCTMETRDKKPGWWSIKHLCKLHFTKDSKGKHGRTLCFYKTPTGHK